MYKLILVLISILVVFSGSVIAQLSGGGDLNPDLKVPVEAQEKWMDLRIGLSVHWGPSSLGGEEISWSRKSVIPRETYDNYYKEFAPIKFDANEWAELMKRWGVKYMAPTAKHHDGFCLWYSDDGENWQEYWKAVETESNWDIPFSTKSMGADVPGKKMRFIKIGVKNEEPQAFHLRKIEIFGKQSLP